MDILRNKKFWLGVMAGALACALLWAGSVWFAANRKTDWEKGVARRERVMGELLTALRTATGAAGSNTEDTLNDLVYAYYSSMNEPYYRYYELSLLPDFEYGKQPSWEDVSHWLCYQAAYDPETYSWAAADFDAAAAVLLPDYTVPRENSSYVAYDADSDRFISTGWGDNDLVYYHLTSRSMHGYNNNQGLFANLLPKFIYEYGLNFDIYQVVPDWYEPDNDSPNSAALRAYARHFSYTDENMQELDVYAALHDMLTIHNIPDEHGKILRLKAGEELQAADQMSVVCRLSGDKNLPLTYYSAKREAHELAMQDCLVAFGPVHDFDGNIFAELRGAFWYYYSIWDDYHKRDLELADFLASEPDMQPVMDDSLRRYYLLDHFAAFDDGYEAIFKVYAVDELWYDEAYASASANNAALVDYALSNGYTKENLAELDVDAAMYDMLICDYWPDKQGNGLLNRVRLRVDFQLSGDEHRPLTYLAAEPEIMF